MRVAALYDVHGFRLGLEAVLAEVEREGVDAIVFGGDLFLGPQPAETAELVRSVEASFVRGNCDREPDDWTRSQLDEETIAWSQGWPTTVELDGVLYCHAAPQDDMRPILTDASPAERFDQALAGIDARLVVAGHTHMQFRRDRWVNAGSIGRPRTTSPPSGRSCPTTSSIAAPPSTSSAPQRRSSRRAGRRPNRSSPRTSARLRRVRRRPSGS